MDKERDVEGLDTWIERERERVRERVIYICRVREKESRKETGKERITER